jgi:hypothetical protein
MSDPTSAAQARLAALGQGRPPNADAFPPSSRYHGLPVAIWVAADGSEYAYVRRRFVPPAERFALLHFHVVRQGERLDHIAAAELGDPEQFWLICDANDAVRPDDLLELGRPLRITLPEGVPGPGSGGADA